jgi:hypothetical protein
MSGCSGSGAADASWPVVMVCGATWKMFFSSLPSTGEASCRSLLNTEMVPDTSIRSPTSIPCPASADPKMRMPPVSSWM